MKYINRWKSIGCKLFLVWLNFKFIYMLYSIVSHKKVCSFAVGRQLLNHAYSEIKMVTPLAA